MNIPFPLAPAIGVILFVAVFLMVLGNVVSAMTWWELREIRKRAGLIPVKKPTVTRRLL